jgi:hypothetical protein
MRALAHTINKSPGCESHRTGAGTSYSSWIGGDGLQYFGGRLQAVHYPFDRH